MLPIGPLMAEHRLIERLVHLLAQELERLKSNVAVDPEFAFVDPVFIDAAVDFLRTYADRCHHGKEEDLLFAALAAKELTPEHRRLLEELTREHVWARELTRELMEAKRDHLRQDPGALERILRRLEALVELYPRHIATEDQEFFLPVMEYFSAAEKEELLARMAEFDRQLIHEKYRSLVEAYESRRACQL
jgi:hemerythrin-like domain-containing protein